MLEVGELNTQLIEGVREVRAQVTSITDPKQYMRVQVRTRPPTPNL